MSDDYDSPWKEVTERYFREFMEFFFPQAYGDIDWERGYEFLDKEFQQITKDAEIGRKYVDKLAKVWLNNGHDAWAMIHADIQTQHEDDFAERMYVYNYRLFDRFGRHAASFAVMGDSGKSRQADTFEQELWGCSVCFRFPVIRLGDYARRSEELENSGNPFAVVVMAHILAQATAKDSDRRMSEKLRLTKMLYRRGFPKQDIINLFRFVDWLMALPETQEKLFWDELSVMEKEEKMPYITSVERIGYRRGMEDGILRGVQQGVQQGIMEGICEGLKEGIEVALSVRFGEEGTGLMPAIRNIADTERLRAVKEAVRTAKNISELRTVIGN